MHYFQSRHQNSFLLFFLNCNFITVNIVTEGFTGSLEAIILIFDRIRCGPILRKKSG